MADKVRMKALRQFIRTGGTVQAGAEFEATEEEARRYAREKNPLAERVGGSADEEETESYESSWNKDELQAEVEKRGLEVEGTGEGGRVLKADLAAALEADDAKKS